MNPSDLSQQLLKHRNLALLLLGALLYVAFTGLHDLWYPDELDIAEVAKAMYLSGDWVSPRRMGVIWVDYPPMIYWTGTFFSHLLGGMSAFSLRLGNGLAAIGTALIVCSAASRWFDARSGLWAGFALLTFQQFVYQGNGYRPDVLFTLFITAGMVVYAAGAGEKPRWLLRLAGFALLGLAMLSKGPLGMLLPGLAFTLWHGARREWRRILELAPLALVSVAIYLAWFMATARAMGWDNILYELYAQNLERFMDASTRGHANPFYYYFRNLWIDLIPWSWLIPPAFIWIVRSGRWRDPQTQLVLWWLASFLVFLSFAATKRQLYLLPAYPAVALLLGPWLARVGQTLADPSPDAPRARPVRIYSLILAIALSLSGIALLIATARLPAIIAGMDVNEQIVEVAQKIRIPLGIMGVLVFASGLWIGQAWRKGAPRAALRRIGWSHVAFYIILLSLALPALDPVKSYASQSRWIREQIGSETHFGMVYPDGSLDSRGKQLSSGVARRGGFAYYTEAMVDLLDSRDEVEAFFRKYPNSVVLIHEGSVDLIFHGQEEAWRARVIGQLRTSRHVYVVIRGPNPTPTPSVPQARSDKPG